MSVGLAQRWPMGLVPGMLELTTSTSILQVFTRRVTILVGLVSPSAVWYTNSQTCQLYFVRSGHLNIHRGDLAAVGSNGYNRSSIAGGTNWGQLLGFAEDVVVPSDGSHDRQYGLPVRCLVILVDRKK